jgi:hypothetical protein
MGAGETAVLGEAADVLALRQIVQVIDLDAFGPAHLLSAGSLERWRNVRQPSIYLQKQCRLGSARAMEDEARLKLCRDILPAARTVVCRVTASMKQ